MIAIKNIYFDDKRKALMGHFSEESKDYIIVLKFANQVNLNGDVYTENCLKDIAKKWKNKQQFLSPDNFNSRL